VVDRTRGVLLVACAGLLWSTSGLGVRLMEDATAWQIVFFRGLFQSAAIFAVVFHRHRGELRRAFLRIGLPGVVGALALAVSYTGMIIALTRTTVALTVFVFSAAPLVSGALAWLVLREPMRWITGAALGVAVLGIFVMTLGESAGGHMVGIVAAIIAVFGYSTFTVALRKGRDVDMLPAVALGGVVAALTSATMIDSYAMSARDLALSGYLGAVALALGLALFTAGSRHLTSAELPLIAMTETILAPIWVWLFLGERVSATTLLGGGIVLAAVLIQAVSAGYRPRGPIEAKR
jgi:DME family drug/metabolite transporter